MVTNYLVASIVAGLARVPELNLVATIVAGLARVPELNWRFDIKNGAIIEVNGR